MSVINITILKQFVENKSIDQVKLDCEDLDISVREFNYIKEVDLSQLYLLYSDKNKTPLQHQCNGVILEKNTNKVICSSHNKFHVLDKNQEEETQNLNRLNEELNQYKIELEYCEDGTVIRLYHYNGQWYTATTRCIDARKSYWSSDKTFDDMFWEIFNASSYDISNLDTNYTYSFILIHKENRIVVNHKYNNLIYINRIHNEIKEEDFTNYFYNQDPRRCIRRTKQIENMSINYPLDDYYLSDKRGVILKFLDQETNSWKLYQYDFNSYTQIKEVRGNVPLIRMRYLELLTDPEKLQVLESNYPEHAMTFSMIKHCMNKLYREVHNLYYQSHIKHNVTVEESHKLYRTLKQLHGQYKKQGTIITIEEVIKKVNSLDKNVIKTLIGWNN